MSVISEIKNREMSLTSYANSKTGKVDTDLTNAVLHLAEGRDRNYWHIAAESLMRICETPENASVFGECVPALEGSIGISGLLVKIEED